MSENLTGMTHSDPRPSEIAAAVKAARGKATLKAAILAALEAQANLTPDEHAERTGALINTVRRRFVDLWKEGKIRPTATTRPNARGNPTTAYELGADPQAQTRPRGKPVEADIYNSEVYGLRGRFVEVIVILKREEWDRIPSPARVRFI